MSGKTLSGGKFHLQVFILMQILLCLSSLSAQWQLGERKSIPLTDDGDSTGARAEIVVVQDSVYILYHEEISIAGFNLAVVDTTFGTLLRQQPSLIDPGIDTTITDLRMVREGDAVYAAYSTVFVDSIGETVHRLNLERLTLTMQRTGDLVEVTQANQPTYSQYIDDAPVMVVGDTIYVFTKRRSGNVRRYPFHYYAFEQTESGLIPLSDDSLEVSIGEFFPDKSFLKTLSLLWDGNRILLVYGQKVAPDSVLTPESNYDILIQEYTPDWSPGTLHQLLPEIPDPEGNEHSLETYPIGFASFKDRFLVAHPVVHRSIASMTNHCGHDVSGGTLWLRVVDAQTMTQVETLQLTNTRPGDPFAAKHPVLVKMSSGALWVVYHSHENYTAPDSVCSTLYAQRILTNGNRIEDFVQEDLPPRGGISLSQNYPNPFNPSTTVHFVLARSGHVVLKLYDLRGKEVGIYVDGWLPAGEHSVTVDLSNRGSGIYFSVLTTGSHELVRKMILID